MGKKRKKIAFWSKLFELELGWNYHKTYICTLNFKNNERTN